MDRADTLLIFKKIMVQKNHKYLAERFGDHFEDLVTNASNAANQLNMVNQLKII